MKLDKNSLKLTLCTGWLLHTLEVCAIQEEKKLMLKSDKQPMCAFLNTILCICMYVGCS